MGGREDQVSDLSQNQDIMLLRQQSENLAYNACQSLVDLSNNQDQSCDSDHEQPDDAIPNQYDASNSLLEVQTREGKSHKTGDWLYDLVFLPYALSCIDPSTQDPANSPNDTTASDTEEYNEKQSPSDMLSMDHNSLAPNPSTMQMAICNPGAATSLITELLADWTALSEKEIQSITSDAQAPESKGSNDVKDPENVGEMIQFEDAVGRKFLFPFYRVKKYKVIPISF